MFRELSFYQIILKECLRISILAFSGLSKSKKYQKNEARKAEE